MGFDEFGVHHNGEFAQVAVWPRVFFQVETHAEESVPRADMSDYFQRLRLRPYKECWTTAADQFVSGLELSNFLRLAEKTDVVVLRRERDFARNLLHSQAAKVAFLPSDGVAKAHTLLGLLPQNLDCRTVGRKILGFRHARAENGQWKH